MIWSPTVTRIDLHHLKLYCTKCLLRLFYRDFPQYELSKMTKPSKHKKPTSSFAPALSIADAAAARERRLALESGVANRIVRAQLKANRRRIEKRERSSRRRKRQKLEAAGDTDALPAPKLPKTIESERVYDDETGKPLTREEALSIDDEFTKTLSGEVRPRVVVTTCLDPTPTSYDFCRAILPVFPGSTYYERKRVSIAEFCTKAIAKGVSDVLIIKEDHKKLSTLTHVHLPAGPTAIYKITSFVPTKRIARHGRLTGHTPEVILNNFSTALGARVGRMLGSLFPHNPNFVGRQAATFHNQRDYIFFRFHRYVFASSRDKARLQELGPRFTLKLRNLQKGTFQDPEKAENEFRWKTKTDINRRRFFL